MTDTEKIERLDRQLKEKYPDIRESEYEEFRTNWIRKRQRMKLWLIIAGTLVMVCGMALSRVSMAAFWGGFIGGFALSMTGVGMGQYLPAVKPKKAADVSEEFLTADRIARDCAKGKKGSIGWFFLFFTLAVAACGIPANGLEGILNLWWLFGPLAALCIFFIIRAQIKGRKLEAELQQGDFHLICCPLNDKEEEEDSSGDTTTYRHFLYFNYHPEHGRYKLEVGGNRYALAEVGKYFYVVLRKNRAGKMEPMVAYSAAKNPLDAQLKEMQKRDVALVGDPLSQEEELKAAQEKYRIWQEEHQPTPEEKEKMAPQVEGWMRKATAWAIVLVVMCLTFLGLSFWLAHEVKALEKASTFFQHQDVAWYWKLLFTLAAGAGCGVPCWLHFKYSRKVHDYDHWLIVPGGGNGRFGCLRVILLCIALFAGMGVCILNLVIWKVLT